MIGIKNTQKNCTPIVTDALCKMQDSTILFEKGTYMFEKLNCFTGDFYPSNNASGKKNVIFPILNKKNITIDGNGSVFMFCDRIFPFIIQNSENITLRNFTIDFSFPRHAEGIVKKSDENGFELFIDKTVFEYRVKDGNLIFKTGSEEISTADKKFFLRDINDAKVALSYLFAGDSTDKKESLPAKIQETDAVLTDNGVYFKYREGSKKVIYPIGDKIFIGNDENRENDVIFCEFSKNLKFENITILRGAGMGIIGQLCTDIDIENVNIIPREGEDISVTADALHFINCDGKLDIKNCHIEKSIDDAINIHGVYVLVDKVLSDKRITIKYGHYEQTGLIPFLKGDTIYFEKGHSKVSDVIYDDERSVVIIEFEDSIKDVLNVDDILENADRMAEVNISGCTVIDCPHMRLSSKSMTISDNTLSLNYNEILIDDLFDYWYESGCVHDVKIVANKFISDKSNANILIKSCRENRNHKRILIENNTFANTKDRAMRISSVDELIERDNVYEK